ncbi:MAG: hypothetical protein ABIR81_11070, partial [Ginsengibacter sp.]
MEKSDDTNLHHSQSLPDDDHKQETERANLWRNILEKEKNRLRLEFDNLAKAYTHLASEKEQLQRDKEQLYHDFNKEKQRFDAMFNDDMLLKLYYSDDWKTILKIYGF